MTPALAALLAAIGFVGGVRFRSAREQQSAGVPCPQCQNGGVCSQSDGSTDSTGTWTGSDNLASIVCLCPAPWTGPRCTERSGDGESARDEDNEDAVDERPVEKPKVQEVSTTTFPNFGAFIQQRLPSVILLTLVFRDADEAVLRDSDSVALSVYSVLCPSAPCKLGLALEDIQVLDVAGSAVRLAISAPRGGGRLNWAQFILESELGDGGMLRTDGFEAVIPQQSSVQFASFPTDAEREAWRSAAKIGTARREALYVSMHHLSKSVSREDPETSAQDASKDSEKSSEDSESSSKTAPAPAPTESEASSKMAPAPAPTESEASARIASNATEEKGEEKGPKRVWIARRDDQNVDLIGQHDTSTAIACICVLAGVYLLITVLDVMIERCSVWLFPPELGVCAVSEETSEEQGQTSADRQRQEFMAIKYSVAFCKMFISQASIASSLMYMAHGRARELTMGFGDPPQACRISMIGLTSGIISLAILSAVHAWFKHREETAEKNKVRNNDKSPIHVVVLTLMGVDIFLIVFFYCVMLVSVQVMDPASCMSEPHLAKALWKKAEPPDLSMEHRLCWQLCVQYMVVNVAGLVISTYASFRVNEPDDPNEGDDDDDDVNQLLNPKLGEKKARERQEAQNKKVETIGNNFRMLHKSANLAGYVSVLALILREVIVDEDSQAAMLREWLLQTISWLMMCYVIFTAVFVVLPKKYGCEFEFPAYVVPFGSSLDYLTAKSAVKEVASSFMFIRRCQLATMYILIVGLSFSVFFGENTSDGVYVMPVVPWPVVWALLVMTESVFFKTMLLLHEVFVGPRDHTKAGETQTRARIRRNEFLTLESAVREVECFIGLCPLLSLVFIVALGRAKELNSLGHVQPFQLTAMNLTCQMILLQMLLAVVEATWRKLSFVDYKVQLENDKQNTLGGTKTDVGSSIADPFDPTDIRPTYPESPPPSLASLQEGESGIKLGPRENARDEHLKKFGESHPMGYEYHYLVTRFVKFVGTGTQAILLSTQVFSILVLMVGTVCVDTPYQLRMEDSQMHNKESMMPLLPRNAPMSSALECVLWFAAIFYGLNAITTIIYCMHQIGYTGTQFYFQILSRARELCETIPNVTVLYVTARIQASILHGINAAPPIWMQYHMYIVWIAFTVELFSSVLTPGISMEFIQVHKHKLIVPIIRTTSFVIQALSSIAMYEGIFALVIGMIFMKPEYIILPDGRTGVPWRGEGEEARLPAVALNMWYLTFLVFVPAAAHKITQGIIIVRKLQMGNVKNMRKVLWSQCLKTGSFMRRTAVLHHALIMVRETVMSAIILGILFIPMVELRDAQLQAAETGEKQETQLLVSLLNASFFVASLLLLLKTMLVFSFGILEVPLEGEIFPNAAETVEDVTEKDDEEEQPFVEFQNFSNSWQAEVNASTAKAVMLSRLFKRLAVFITLCEFCLTVFLFAGMAYLRHDQERDTIGGELFHFGPAVQFQSYVIVYYVTFLVLLLDKPTKFFDQLADTVVMSPLLVMISIGTRLRALEVAGPGGVVPNWVRNVDSFCAVLSVSEMSIAVLLLPLPMRRFWKTGSMYKKNEMDDYVLDHQINQDVPRLLSICIKMIVRFLIYCSIGCIVFALFWMTEDQCLPDDDAPSEK